MGILETDSADLFLGYFSDGVRRILEQEPALLGVLPDSVPMDYQLHMVTSEIVETVRWWAAHRMPFTPDQVVSFFTTRLGATN